VFFGLQGIFLRIAYDNGANVSGAIAGRALAVVPLLAALALMPARRRRARLAARQLVPMACISVVNTITYFVAVDRMSPALVTLIIYIYPAIAVVGSRLLGWTRITALTAVAVAATIGGVALTVGLPDGAVDSLAALLCLVNGTLFAIWLLLAQAALRRVDPFTCFAASVGVAQAVLLVGSFVVASPSVGTDPAAIAAIAGAGLLSTVLAFLLQLGGIARIGGAATALVTTLEIVTVVAVSAAIFDDPLGAAVFAGSLLIVTGAILAPISTRPRAVAELATAG
jgi:drug/metabolite transporter (DMT)-like permease